MGRVTAEQRTQIITYHGEGWPQRKIAAKVGCFQHSVSHTIRRAQETGNTKDRSKSGRPQKTTPQVDRVIHRLSEKDRRLTAEDIQGELATFHDVNVSTRTIRRRLCDVGLNERIARKVPYLTERHKKRRYHWAKQHRHLTIQNWEEKVFSDESKQNRTGSDGRMYVRRRKNEEFNQKVTQGTVKGGVGSVLFWGCFTANGLGPIARIQGTMNAEMYTDILATYLLAICTEEHAGWLGISMQDNDPKHTSKKAKKWFDENDIKIMDWPAQSPDLNPIENLWAVVDSDVKKKKPRNLDELWKVIKESWDAIPADYCRKLVHSMPKRIAEVLKVKGGPTRYWMYFHMAIVWWHWYQLFLDSGWRKVMSQNNCQFFSQGNLLLYHPASQKIWSRQLLSLQMWLSLSHLPFEVEKCFLLLDHFREQTQKPLHNPLSQIFCPPPYIIVECATLFFSTCTLVTFVEPISLKPHRIFGTLLQEHFHFGVKANIKATVA